MRDAILIAIAVAISTIIMVAFPDDARRAVQKWTPWGGEPETAQPVAGSVKTGTNIDSTRREDVTWL